MSWTIDIKAHCEECGCDIEGDIEEECYCKTCYEDAALSGEEHVEIVGSIWIVFTEKGVDKQREFLMDGQIYQFTHEFMKARFFRNHEEASKTAEAISRDFKGHWYVERFELVRE